MSSFTTPPAGTETLSVLGGNGLALGLVALDAQAVTNASGIATNLTAIGLNTTHKTSDGTDHTYINQDLRTTASPYFAKLAIGTSTVESKRMASIIGELTSVDPVGLLVNMALTPTYDLFGQKSANGIKISNSFVEPASGAFTQFNNASFGISQVTAGVATVANTANVYIEGAMSATVTGENYALWVDAGPVQVDETINAGGDIQTSGAIISDEIKAGTADKPVTVSNGTVNTPVAYTPEGAATATLDVSNSNIHSITMPAGNITIAISNETVGQCFLVEITQDGSGSRTVTWFSTIKWAGGSAPTLTTTASKRDTFRFRVTGADTYDGYIVGQNI